jgi:hypothetical protein
VKTSDEMDRERIMSGILEVLPDAMFGDDNDGQLIIYTNFDTNFQPLDEPNLTGV